MRVNWPQNQQQPGPWDGGYPPQSPPPGHKGSGGLSRGVLLFLAVVLATVIIIAVAVVVVSLSRTTSQAAPAGTETTAPEPVEETETASQEPSPAPDSRLMQEGWQRAAAPKWGFVYEVPPREDGWKYDGPTMFRGFEDEDGDVAVGMSGTSVYREEPCRGWGNRALLGAQGITDSDDTEAMSEAVALNWAFHAYNDNGDPGRSLRSVEKFSANGLTGHHAIVDVSVAGGDDDCVPSSAVVHALAAPDGDGGSRIFLMLVDNGVEDALDEETVDTIISTLRDTDYEV